MRILRERITFEDLKDPGRMGEGRTWFADIVKCVVDVERGLVAINAELHSDLEGLLLQDGSDNRDLYGINILLETAEIEYDALINLPRNRDAGYLRAGRTVADPVVRQKIDTIVRKWIEM